jgi:hypothetical protein
MKQQQLNAPTHRIVDGHRRILEIAEWMRGVLRVIRLHPQQPHQLRPPHGDILPDNLSPRSAAPLPASIPTTVDVVLTGIHTNARAHATGDPLTGALLLCDGADYGALECRGHHVVIAFKFILYEPTDAQLTPMALLMVPIQFTLRVEVALTHEARPRLHIVRSAREVPELERHVRMLILGKPGIILRGVIGKVIVEYLAFVKRYI